jgi:predicted DsbA family dithiol-disulfide isomerase
MKQPSRDTITIDVVSDFVCPWCFIGLRRLQQALAQPDATPHRVRWHPFQLSPDIPPAGLDRRTYLESKLGGPERLREIYSRVQAAGLEAGIEFDFEGISRQPNTLESHRLVAWAQQVDPARASALVERVFAAYFLEGTDIGDASELTRLAAEAGYAADEAAAFLSSGAGRAQVSSTTAEAQRMGISGVPFFVFGGRLAISGAQPADVLRQAIAQAARG